MSWLVALPEIAGWVWSALKIALGVAGIITAGWWVYNVIQTGTQLQQSVSQAMPIIGLAVGLMGMVMLMMPIFMIFNLMTSMMSAFRFWGEE